MPTFSSVKATVEVDIDVDFEIFCGSCGAGLCDNGSTRESYRRRQPQVVVDPCQKCLETARDEGATEASKKCEAEMDELRRQLEEATNATKTMAAATTT